MSKSEHLYQLLKETFIMLNDGDNRFFERFNLTVPHYYALHHLHEYPGISISELSRRLLCDKSNATRIVKVLERNGYVTRRAHETDGRTLRLSLTEEGQQLRRQASEAHADFIEARLGLIDAPDQTTLVEGLTLLNSQLRHALSMLEEQF